MQPQPNHKHKSIMAFDFGSKRIGMATGQRDTQIASPLGCVKADNGIPHWDALDAFVEEWQPHAFVVGLPINMDGSPSEMSRRANKFSNRLQARYKRASFTIDERLSTFEAKQEAKAQGHKGHYKSDPVDAIAAQLILETWFAEHPYLPETDPS